LNTVDAFPRTGNVSNGTAAEHHSALADRHYYICDVPLWMTTIQTGCRTPAKPPTTLASAVSITVQVVIDIRRAERHPVCLPVVTVMCIVESVFGVAMVAGHVQSVLVGL